MKTIPRIRKIKRKLVRKEVEKGIADLISYGCVRAVG